MAPNTTFPWTRRTVIAGGIGAVAAAAGITGARVLREPKMSSEIGKARASPNRIARPRVLNTMASLNDISEARGFSEVDDPYAPSGPRVLEARMAGGESVDAVIRFEQPADIRNGALRFNVRHIANVNSMELSTVELHSGPPGEQSSNFTRFLGPNQFIWMNRFFSTSDGANGGRWQVVGASTLATFPVGGEDDLSAVRWIKLSIRAAPGDQVGAIRFGPIEFQPNPLDRAKLLIGFDDAYESCYRTGFPLMRSHAMPGIVFPGAAQEVVGQPGRLNIAQMREMQSAGWQIASQAWSSEQVQSQLEIDALAEWMRVNGFSGGAFASYYTSIGERRLDKWPFFRDNYRAVRTFNTPLGDNPPLIASEMYPWIDPGAVHAVGASSPDAPVDYREALIEQAIAAKGVAMLVWHADLVGLEAVLDYAARRREAIDVVTESNLVARFGLPTSMRAG